MRYGSVPGWVVSRHSIPMKPMFVGNDPPHVGAEGLTVGYWTGRVTVIKSVPMPEKVFVIIET